MLIYSMISEEEISAIYCYVTGFNDEGKAIMSCDRCTDELKEILGCGYDSRYAGKAVAVSGSEYDLKGICPVWWRRQPFVESVVYCNKFRNTLGDARLWPARLGYTLMYYDMMEAEQYRKKNKKET